MDNHNWSWFMSHESCSMNNLKQLSNKSFECKSVCRAMRQLRAQINTQNHNEKKSSTSIDCMTFSVNRYWMKLPIIRKLITWAIWITNNINVTDYFSLSNMHFFRKIDGRFFTKMHFSGVTWLKYMFWYWFSKTRGSV